MKIVKIILLALLVAILPMVAQAQRPQLQFFRPNDKAGLNVFEAPKVDTVDFEGVAVRVGGDFALQYQGLSQSNDLVGDTLVELGSNFNLPTANLNIDVQLYDGMRMHLRTYLSSRHHSEAWVKGGYLRIDKLDFISEGFLQNFMDIAFIKIGLDEVNYGDAHFRRSDNARAIYNPFVGNYIMDAFATEAFGEVTVLAKSGIIGMLGVSNGRLNQSVTSSDKGMSIYGKLGYDNAPLLSDPDDLRFRLTGSFYRSSEESTRDYIYGGDRAGGRYYATYQGRNDSRVNDFSPRFNPGYASLTTFQVNPFISVDGLEFFGIYEVASNNLDEGGSFTQIAGDLLYRFGAMDQIYVGTRFNSVTGEIVDGAPSGTITRFNIGGGWFMTQNVVAKAEYVTESYTGDVWNGTKLQGAGFNGFVLEAAISF